MGTWIPDLGLALADHEVSDEELAVDLGVSGTLTGQGPVRLLLFGLGGLRGWQAACSTTACHASGQASGCRALLKDSRF